MATLQWERMRSEIKTDTGANVVDGSRVERARVPGGWLLRIVNPAGGNGGGSVVVVFVADCGEEWPNGE